MPKLSYCHSWLAGKEQSIHSSPREKLRSQSSALLSLHAAKVGYAGTLSLRKEAIWARVAASFFDCQAICVATEPSIKLDSVYPVSERVLLNAGFQQVGEIRSEIVPSGKIEMSVNYIVDV